MKKVIAALLTAILVLANAACSNKPEPDPETSGSETSATTADITETDVTPSESTTETTVDLYGEEHGPTRVTEAAEYGSSEVADLCEFMQSITGKKVYMTAALVLMKRIRRERTSTITNTICIL